MRLPAPTGVEIDPPLAATSSVTLATATVHPPGLDRRETLPGVHFRLTQVEFQDRTDHHNELVHVREWLVHPSGGLPKLVGNLFVLENTASGEGRVFVRRSPLPHAHCEPRETDLSLRVHPDRVDIELGLTSSEVGAPSPWTVLGYAGGALGRTRVLHRWQQSLRPATPGHQLPRFITNTWGDRSRDSRIQHDFILREIEAAAALGADVLQIDDGWQKGKSANSAFIQNRKRGASLEGFWSAMPEFWTPNPARFPQGLAPLATAARARGLELGLWFAPDSEHEFANWEKDAAVLLELHRTHGIDHFKIDGVQAPTALAQARLARFFESVLAGSEGRIVLDLDITAGTRPGYFGAIPIGPLFVENRYTDWRNYWPHQTLRTLWRLAPWVDPRRLRLEFLNVARNAEKYPADPLAPALHPADYLFATVMFANPLGWFEASNLPPEAVARLRPLVNTWRAERAALFAGALLPLGAEPDGFSWTGFASLADDGASGYLLVFRESNPSPAAELRLPFALPGSAKTELLGGEGELSLARDRLDVRISARPGFLFARFRSS